MYSLDCMKSGYPGIAEFVKKKKNRFLKFEMQLKPEKVYFKCHFAEKFVKYISFF